MSKIQKKHHPRISMIAAIASNRGIGLNNKLLFQIPEDLKYFRDTTSGYPVIMGERTFYSIGSRPLPGRLNIILTKNHDIKIEGCSVCFDIEEAIKLASKNNDKEIFIVGGGMIYSLAIKFADRLYLTIVDAESEADTFFPDYSDFTKVISEKPSQYKNLKFKYVVLEK